MRFLGFIVVIALVIAVVGYLFGWFSVTTTRAGGKGEVTFGVDHDKVGDDTKAVAKRLGELSAKAAEAVRKLARKVSSEESDLEGAVVAVDVPARALTVTVDSQTIDLDVPTAIPIEQDGDKVDFGRLRPAARVKLTFEHDGDDRRLSRIEILD